MKALICNSFGPVEALRLGEMDMAVPEAGEIVIAVACAGASFADGLVVQGKHVARPPFPFVPGVEAAGTVTAIGAAVTRRSIGDRVVVFAPRGAFAEYLRVDERRAFALPSGVSFEAGAAGLVSYGTALHALSDRAGLRAGETLLVLGAAGSAGLAAVEIGRLLGARVIAAASSDDKRALALSKGADRAIGYTDDGFRDALREVAPEGIDVVFDPVGGSAAEIVGRALRTRGRHLIVGFASGQFPALAANIYLVKQASTIGVLWGESGNLATQDANIACIMSWLAEGRLVPEIGGIFPLENGVEALLSIMERRISGKALIAMGGKTNGGQG